MVELTTTTENLNNTVPDPIPVKKSPPKRKRPPPKKKTKSTDDILDQVAQKLLIEPEYDDSYEHNSQPVEYYTSDKNEPISSWIRLKDFALNLNHLTSIFVNSNKELVVVYMGVKEQRFPGLENPEYVRDQVFDLLNPKVLD